jgi:hypothetical protein
MFSLFFIHTTSTCIVRLGDMCNALRYSNQYFICVLGISNLHISTIFLLNARTVSTVWYLFFSFYYKQWKKNSWVAIVKKKYGCDPSSVIKSSKWNTAELKSNGDLFQPHLKFTLTFLETYTSRSRSFITRLFHSSIHFFSVLVKGLYQTESYSLHVIQLARI